MRILLASMAKWRLVVFLIFRSLSLPIFIPPGHASGKSLTGGFIDRQSENLYAQTFIFRAGRYALKTHHAVILDNILALHIFGNSSDAHIADPITVAAFGAFLSFLDEPQQSALVKDIVKGAHGAKEAKKSLFHKGTS